MATRDGKYLIIAKRNENALFRVDLKSKEIVPITMPTGMLNTPDGLFIDGNTLYVAQNTPKAVIGVVKLSTNFTSASLQRNIPASDICFSDLCRAFQGAVTRCECSSLTPPEVQRQFKARNRRLCLRVSEIPVSSAGALPRKK